MRKLLLSALLLVSTIKLLATSPTLVSPANDSINAPTTICLQWQHLAGASFYDIDVDSSLQFNSPLHKSLAGTINYNSAGAGSILRDTIKELHFGTKYYWKITPRNMIGGSPSAANTFITTNQTRISGPAMDAHVDFMHAMPAIYHDLGTHFYYLEVGNTTIFTSPVYYQMYGDMILIAHNTVLTLGPATGLNINSSYYWRVKAYNLEDSSNWSDTMSFVAIDPLSTIEINEKNISFYPNPASDFLKITAQSQGIKITIYNSEGQKVLEEITNNAQENIPIENLSSGLYFITINESASKIVTYKLFISH